MSNTIWLIVMISVVLFFTIFALKDKPSEPPRRDDRDPKKAPELNSMPAGRDADEQPSELLVPKRDESK